jgi:GT2 family glycosyltransferase
MSITTSHTAIEFCICTYNRKEYLQLCLEALIPQLVAGTTKLTVVDNHSTDGTAEYIRSLQEGNHAILYLYEPLQGLSHARNAGWKIAVGEWVFYIDDDCLPPAGLVDAALELIRLHTTFDAFGGPIDPVFTEERPAWLPEGFGAFSMPYHEVTEISRGYIRGGCMLIRKAALESLGGFSTELGVKGDELRYGEEIELQLRMRQAGYKIAYAPSLRTGHFVRTDKLKLSWILHSEYARQRDRMIFDPVSFPGASFHLIRTLFGRLLWTPVHLLAVLFNKSYSLKKAVYKIMQPLAFTSGRWVGSFLKLFGR